MTEQQHQPQDDSTYTRKCKKTIHFLVKVFEKKEYADDLLKGSLFVNRLSYFKKIEGSDGRGDKDEGAIMLPIDRACITLEATFGDTGETERFTIPQEDHYAPPIIRPQWFDHINVYCMYAIQGTSLKYITPNGVEDFRKQLELPEDVEKLGRHAVVIANVPEFIKRVKATGSRKEYKVCYKSVKYYDAEEGSPPLRSEVETIFTKRKEFEYQREFRIAIDTSTPGCAPITFDIGSIADIAYYTDTSDINRQIRQMNVRFGCD